MQTIAAEFGFSETTFVESTRTERARVRIFTPTDEIPFAGHPTLGTAFVVREHLVADRPERIILELEVGNVPVESRTWNGVESLWMAQQQPTFGERLPPERLADVLSLDAEAVDDWPVHIISTGLPTIVVPLRSRDALTHAAIDRAASDAVTGHRDAKNVLAFCADPRDPENDLAVRVFASGLGVPEDPATGSSNGCLAVYLARHAYLGDETVTVRVEQGYELGRPSLLGLEAVDHGDAVDVQVGGRVVPVGRGELT